MVSMYVSPKCFDVTYIRSSLKLIVVLFQGDDGGPIVCKVFGRYELVGMGSWGIMGCDPTIPFVATRIAYFRDWIRRNAGI